MDLFELIDEVTELTDAFVGNMVNVKPERLGLDGRCGSLFVSPDCIAVYKGNDRSLQYYGGFEYINDMHRHEMGDYVFYSREATRVDEALETYLNKEEVE
jgi:hypothetical protein